MSPRVNSFYLPKSGNLALDAAVGVGVGSLVGPEDIADQQVTVSEILI